MSRIRLQIDGVDHLVDPGQNLLSASLGLGVEVPHFCWHDALGSVGACRLCAVRVRQGPDDTEGKVEMACMTPVAEGQRVSLLDPEAAALRAQVIEWLMANHPHDCAVCEEAGACHLQDMTVATGHHKRRFRFPKRTHRNQDLGPLLTHEMNRCIGCYRCTRFYRHYAGGRDLDVFGAHDRLWFGRYEDGPLDSPFAGNLAEVCPTGVFNDKGWSQTYIRKWDMAATPSICGQCSVGCNLHVAERGGEVRRIQNRFHRAINGHFLCDRGRFAVRTPKERRLNEPRINGEVASRSDAFRAARDALAKGAVAIGSPRATLETNWTLRHLVGADRVFAAVSETEARSVAEMAAAVAKFGSASIRDLETADAVLVLGEDLTGTAPRAALALRQAATGAAIALAAEKGVPAWLDAAARVAGEGRKTPVAIVTTLPDALDDVAAWSLRRPPMEIAGFGRSVADAATGSTSPEAPAEEIAAALRAAERPVIVVGSGTEQRELLAVAESILKALGPRARLAAFPPEAGSMALALMRMPGIDGAIAALEGGEARTVLIAEADLEERIDPLLAERLFAAAGTVIALDSLETPMTRRADIVLPVAGWTGETGTLVNHERRAQRRFAAYPSNCPAAWRVIADLHDARPEWRGLDDLLAAMARDLPQLAAARTAAPDAAYRLPLGKVARATWRISGRTADDLAGRVAEGTPPEDADAPLTFSMEGARQGVPASLSTGLALPGWHSSGASPLGMADPAMGEIAGALVLHGLEMPQAVKPSDPLEDGDGLIPVPLHDPFAGDEIGRAALPISRRLEPAIVLLHPEDAASLGLGDGDLVSVNGAAAVPLRIEPCVPSGHVAASVGRVLPRGIGRRVSVETVE